MSFMAAEYRIWAGMIRRCEDPRTRGYRWYGARGVRVCQRWRDSFEAFLSDVGPRPTQEHSLDRYPNRAGDYEPGNVRWATRKEQFLNRDCTLRVVIDGVERPLMAVLDELGLDRVERRRVRGRIRQLGWTALALADAVKAIEAERDTVDSSHHNFFKDCIKAVRALGGEEGS